MKTAMCHSDKKHYSKGLCKVCYDTNYYFENKQKRIAYNAQHKEKIASYRINHKEESFAYNAKYRAKHKKERYADAAIYRKTNPDKINAFTAKRRAAKLNATPPWLTKDQLKEIAKFYTLAKELQWLSDEPLEVDHITPLQGENVSGLHVPWNLQILPKSANCSKGNGV
jgi:hypothetical protein